MALATLEIVVEGISLKLRGVRLMRCAGASVAVELPTVRDELGKAAPVIDFPPEIADAIDLAVRREVVETVVERGVFKCSRQ